MPTPRKCIIDNWSLEHAGRLLEDSYDLNQHNGVSLLKNLGGLSNFINAVLLYGDSFFLMNGFEKHWKQFNWFAQNASAFIQGIELDELAIDWNGPSAYKNKGLHNYLHTSRYFSSDLLVCPERSEEVLLTDNTLNSTFFETLQSIDKKISHEIDQLSFSKIKLSIRNNFRIPSLTQYVLSEASGRSDLLTVIMQLKSDRKIEKIIQKIETITQTTKGAGKFEADIKYLVQKSFGKKAAGDTSWSVTLSVPYFGVSKTIDLNFFRRQQYLVFLRTLIACRTEVLKMEKDVQRIFNRKLNS